MGRSPSRKSNRESGPTRIERLEAQLRAERARVAALLEIEANFQLILDNASGFAIFRLASDSTAPLGVRVAFASPSLVDLLAPEEPQRLEAWFSRAHPEDLPLLEAAHQAISREGRPLDLTIRVLHPHKGLRWIRILDQPVLDEAGRPDHGNGLIIDVTDQVQARQALEESERRYRTLVEMAPSAVSVQLDDRFVYVNPAMTVILGATDPGQLIGRDVFDFLAPEYLDLARRRRRAIVLEDAAPDWVEFQFVRLDGQRVDVLATGRRIVFNGQAAVLSVAKDSTESMRAEADRRLLERQLAQAQKMEALGTLAGGIAHDFNNILGAITGFTELSLLEVAADSPVRANLEQALKGCRRAAELVKQILAFSRRTEVEPRPLLPSPLIKEALKLLRATLPTTIALRLKLGQERGVVLADPIQLHQILMNLCANAAQAMAESGGTITVSSAEVWVEPVDIPGHPPPGLYYRLTVADTGPGIDPAIRDKIFEPYFTTKAPGEGTGLGLAVVHGLARSLGGAVQVQSQPGQGADFHVFLPLQEARPDPSLIQVKADQPRGVERVLVVDDEPDLADLTRHVLARLGYVVTALTSPREALALFQAQPHAFDLVMTDQTMPHLTGLALAQELHRIRPELPVILCTGSSHLLPPEALRQAGISRVLDKPLLAYQTAQAIRQVLDRSV